MEVVRSELSRIAKSGNSKNLKSLLERIIVNQIEMLPDNQVQDDFEKDLTARQRFIPSESARVSSGREKPVSALTRSGEETGKCAYVIHLPQK